MLIIVTKSFKVQNFLIKRQMKTLLKMKLRRYLK